MNDRFGEKRVGEHLTASGVNAMQRALERLSSTGVGGPGITTDTFRASSPDPARTLTLVRMASDTVDAQDPLNDPDPSLPQLYNAVEQVWDDDLGWWADLADGYLSIDAPYGRALDKDSLVPCFLQDGRWVAFSASAVRLGKTVKATSTNADGTTEQWYPAKTDSPTAYAVTFITAPYPPIPGRWEVPPLGEGVDPLYGVYSSELSVPAGPHATVLNLDAGPDSYIPEGSTVFCYEVGGRWFTGSPQAVSPGSLVFAARITAVTDPSLLVAGVTSGSATLTGVGDNSWYSIGDKVTGVGIPAGATMIAFPSPTTILLSANATATSISADLTVAGAPLRYSWKEQTVGRDGAYAYSLGGRTGSRAICVGNPVVSLSPNPVVWMRPFLEVDEHTSTVTGSCSSGGSVISSVSPDTHAVRVGYAIDGPGFEDGALVTAISGATLTVDRSARSDQAGATYTVTPRPRMVTNYDFLPPPVAATGSKPKRQACSLASTQTSDCLLATCGSSAVMMFNTGGANWASTAPLVYGSNASGPLSGIVTFWYTAGDIHLAISGVELFDCGDGCFTGGPLTGHLPATGAGACAGATFTVCVACQPCPTSVGSSPRSLCCPDDDLPWNLCAVITLPAGCGFSFGQVPPSSTVDPPIPVLSLATPIVGGGPWGTQFPGGLIQQTMAYEYWFEAGLWRYLGFYLYVELNCVYQGPGVPNAWRARIISEGIDQPAGQQFVPSSYDCSAPRWVLSCPGVGGGTATGTVPPFDSFVINAADPCRGSTSPCCPGVTLPTTLTATITGGGACNGGVTLTYDGLTGWYGTLGTCGLSTLSLSCVNVAGVPTWRMQAGSTGSFYMTLASYDCSVPTWTFTGGPSDCGCTGGFTVTVSV
jgi:hypothetical protein